MYLKSSISLLLHSTHAWSPLSANAHWLRIISQTGRWLRLVYCVLTFWYVSFACCLIESSKTMGAFNVVGILGSGWRRQHCHVTFLDYFNSNLTFKIGDILILLNFTSFFLYFSSHFGITYCCNEFFMFRSPIVWFRLLKKV
jgi:hypothetical protein